MRQPPALHHDAVFDADLRHAYQRHDGARQPVVHCGGVWGGVCGAGDPDVPPSALPLIKAVPDFFAVAFLWLPQPRGEGGVKKKR